MTSRNDSSNRRALLETPGELDQEDATVPLKDGISKKQAIPGVRVSVHRFFTCWIRARDTVRPHAKYIHTYILRICNVDYLRYILLRKILLLLFERFDCSFNNHTKGDVISRNAEFISANDKMNWESVVSTLYSWLEMHFSVMKCNMLYYRRVRAV